MPMVSLPIGVRQAFSLLFLFIENLQPPTLIDFKLYYNKAR